MSQEEAQKLAPSYTWLPNDGALWQCSECKQNYKHGNIIIPFTPNGKINSPVCINCIDEDWFSSAKDCGTAS